MNFSIFPLYNYRVKFIGIAFTLLSLLLKVIPVNGINLNEKLTDVILLLGIMLVISSKEKIENDFIFKCRYTAFKASVMIFFSIIISLTFTNYFSSTELNYSLTFIAILVALGYFAVFYLAILIKNDLVADESFQQNVLKNRKFYLIYSITIVFICTAYLVS